MEHLTLQLPPRVMEELSRLSQVEGLSRAALAEKALRYYLFESEFAEIHPQLVRKAAEMGIKTDEDVFRRLG